MIAVQSTSRDIIIDYAYRPTVGNIKNETKMLNEFIICVSMKETNNSLIKYRVEVTLYHRLNTI